MHFQIMYSLGSSNLVPLGYIVRGQSVAGRAIEYLSKEITERVNSKIFPNPVPNYVGIGEIPKVPR